MQQLGFLFDADLCIGCKTCTSACINENMTGSGVIWRRIIETTDNVFLSIACNHCDNPECFRVCPQKAYTKHRNGSVLIDSTRCDGCMICAAACPFSVPQYDAEKHKASKCDLCQLRLRKGLSPACIEACPTEAIQLIDLSMRLPEDTVLTLPCFPDIALTKPSIRFRTLKPRRRYWIKE